jgi:tetratricopeptide (TPR) repeat protein
MGNIGAAGQLFVRAVAERPDNPAARFDLGVVYQREGHDRAALIEYSRSLADDQNYVPALYNKAVLLGPRKPLLAIFYYRRVISLRPTAATAFLNLGLLLADQSATRSAGLNALLRAVRLQPSLRQRIPAALRAQLPRS